MGMSFELDPSLGILVERWEGVITSDMLCDYWSWLFRSDEYLAHDKTLVCLHDAQPAFQVDELVPLIRALVTPYRKQVKHWNAIWITTHEQEYLAEIYLNFSGEAGTSRIFKGRDLAIEWLRKAQ